MATAKIIKVIITFILMVLATTITTFSFAQQHEFAHQEICKEFGGIAGPVEYHWDKFTTACDIDSETSGYAEMQSLNEIVGYPIQILISVFTFIMMCMFVIVVEIWMAKE